jgi:hypothetical protein
MNGIFAMLIGFCVLLFIIVIILAYNLSKANKDCPVQDCPQINEQDCPVCPPVKDCPTCPSKFQDNDIGGGIVIPKLTEEEYGEVKIEIITGDKLFAGTDSDIEITFNSPVVNPIILDNYGKNDFERDDTNIFILKDTFLTKNILLKGFSLKNLGSNDWYFKSIKIYFNDVLVRSEVYNNWLGPENPTANFLPKL